MELEDEIKRAIRGHKDSFSKLIKYFEGSLYKVAKSMLQSDDDCADAIQETILKAYKSISGLREIQFFKTWLIRILINECHNINKLKVKVIPIHEIEGTFNDRAAALDIDDSIQLHEILDSLDNELKSVVILYYFEELPVREIASALNIPEGTVKSRLSRARLKLKSTLMKDFEGSDCCER